MSKANQIFIQILPFLSATVVIHLLWRRDYLLLVTILTMTLAYILWGRDRKIEFAVAIVGTMWGVVIEIIGATVSGYHTFNEPDFFGIPLWVAVCWGFGFVLGKRVVLILTKGSSFSNNS